VGLGWSRKKLTLTAGARRRGTACLQRPNGFSLLYGRYRGYCYQLSSRYSFGQALLDASGAAGFEHARQSDSRPWERAELPLVAPPSYCDARKLPQ